MTIRRALRTASIGSSVALIALASASVVAGSSAATSAGNRAAAQADAARSLALIQLPPSAAATSSEPSGDHHALAQPSYNTATPNLVDAPQWWTVPGTSDDVLRYFEQHLPVGAKPYFRSAGNLATGSDSDGFALPPVRGVLSERVLAITVVDLAHGTVGVRTDGEAVWIVPRPAWERIPADVRRISVTATRATRAGRPGPTSRPRSITGKRARRLVAFINRLGLVQPGVRSCPAAFPTSVRLTFFNARGTVIARATEHPTGCAYVSLRIAGRIGPSLNDYPDVTGELERIGAMPAPVSR